jgi:hypothetical protein
MVLKYFDRLLLTREKILFMNLYFIKMIFLPESFDYIELTTEASAKKAEALNDGLIKSFCKIASENSVWLSLGGFHRRVKYYFF